MNRGVLVALAIAAAAAAGFFVQRQLQAPAPPLADAQPGSSAAPGPAVSVTEDAAAAEVGLKVPDVLPQIELADRDGKKRSLKEWAGKPLMVNYWATWCGPCRREIPLLNAIRKQRAAQGLEIVGIAVDFREDVLKYAEENPISYPLLIGEEDGMEAVSAVGMQPAFPFTVFADSKQRIVALKVGELFQDDADLILDNVIAVDAGKLELARARQEITDGLKANSTRRATEKAIKPSSE
jgi:thiol-disulfide isomerase/thioredoxin